MNRSIVLMVCFFIVFFGQINRVNGQNHTSLIPEPVEVKNLEGNFLLSSKTRIVVLSGNEEIGKAAKIWAGQLKSLCGISPEIITSVKKPHKQSVIFKLNEKNIPRLGEEGYNLDITPQNITVTANNAAGLFYGSQTLLQLVPIEKPGTTVKISCANIVDYPRFVWRGLMLDVSRHFFTKEEVKRFIDQMVKYKYNTFHWHLSDDNGWRIEIKAYPRLTSIGAWSVSRTGRYGTFEPEKAEVPATYGGFYTQDDLREIVK